MADTFPQTCLLTNSTAVPAFRFAICGRRGRSRPRIHIACARDRYGGAFQQRLWEQVDGLERQTAQVLLRPVSRIAVSRALQIVGLEGDQFADEDNGVVKRPARCAYIFSTHRQMVDVGVKNRSAKNHAGRHVLGIIRAECDLDAMQVTLFNRALLGFRQAPHVVFDDVTVRRVPDRFDDPDASMVRE
jgi:hypothetical protein